MGLRPKRSSFYGRFSYNFKCDRCCASACSCIFAMNMSLAKWQCTNINGQAINNFYVSASGVQLADWTVIPVSPNDSNPSVARQRTTKQWVFCWKLIGRSGFGCETAFIFGLIKSQQAFCPFLGCSATFHGVCCCWLLFCTTYGSIRCHFYSKRDHVVTC